VRWRSIVHVLSTELFGQSLALPDFPVRPDIVGIGLSDWDGYAIPLAKKLGYINTFYHAEPMLDIAVGSPDLAGSLDFLISSDVFEHVAPPVSVAFDHAQQLLKPGGVLVLTVPYGKDCEHLEHFPDLYDYEIVEQAEGFVLRNVTRNGVEQRFENLVFHGGPGATLEMRRFSESTLLGLLRVSGFTDIKIYRQPAFDHGIYWNGDWSLPIAARRA
jgi:hypothetical protein